MRTRWSQNFLVDKNIARLCVQALDPGPADPVLEIGPGRGAITGLLLEKTRNLTAVEIDPALCRDLREKFGSGNGFFLHEGDILDASQEDLPAAREDGCKIIGNLPYAVVSPILQKILSWKRWSVAVFMVQKEVGERITARPGSRDYGILSVSVQSRSRCEKAFNVSRTCFRPVPKVESSVIKLRPLQSSVFDPDREKLFFTVVRGSFSHRRKTVLNSLSRSLKMPGSRIREALVRSGLAPEARAETFSVADFNRLSENLYNEGDEKREDCRT